MEKKALDAEPSRDWSALAQSEGLNQEPSRDWSAQIPSKGLNQEPSRDWSAQIPSEDSKQEQFEVFEYEAGERIDKYLSNKTDAYTRSFLQKLILQERVSVNGVTVKANYRVQPSDCIIVNIPKPVAINVKAENIPLDILYEDEDVLIVNKPKGMVVHPSAGHTDGTLVNAVLFHCKGCLSGINGEIRPGIVHRIDKDTSGSIIICKNDASHQAIAAQIKAHSVKRIYRGIVKGRVKEETGTIKTLIGRHPVDRKKMAVTARSGKEAVTHYKVLEYFSDTSYLEFSLETGRTHQIRVHMSYIGHPLLGDEVYGNGKNSYHVSGQALHAMTIGFLHPTTKQYMEFSAPLPEYMENLLMKLRK